MMEVCVGSLSSRKALVPIGACFMEDLQVEGEGTHQNFGRGGTTCLE